MLKFSCTLNMSSFPSDEHNCSLVQSFMGDKWPDVQFGPLMVYKNRYYTENTEYNITAFEVSSLFLNFYCFIYN